jgi:hypothetical protein
VAPDYAARLAYAGNYRMVSVSRMNAPAIPPVRASTGH